MVAKHRILCLLALIAGASGSSHVWAQESDVQTTRTETIFTEEAIAEQWRLSVEEWETYQTLMHGPRGVWTPNLDPVTVLGIHAKTDAERRRYAELLVMIEFERVEQELSFQRAYDAAARKLFPDLLPVAAVEAPETTLLAGTDRLAFVGSVDAQRCPTCRAELVRWLRLHDDPAGPVIDLFLDDADDDQAIRSWAIEQGINPQDVIAGRITLNHARDAMALPADAEFVTPMLMQRTIGRWLELEGPE